LHKNYTFVISLDTSHFYVYNHNSYRSHSKTRARMTDFDTLAHVDFELAADIVRIDYVTYFYQTKNAKNQMVELAIHDRQIIQSTNRKRMAY